VIDTLVLNGMAVSPQLERRYEAREVFDERSYLLGTPNRERIALDANHVRAGEDSPAVPVSCDLGHLSGK